MAELALLIGFLALGALYLLENNMPEEKAPLWMESVHGPYVRKEKKIVTVVKRSGW